MLSVNKTKLWILNFGFCKNLVFFFNNAANISLSDFASQSQCNYTQVKQMFISGEQETPLEIQNYRDAINFSVRTVR